MMTVPNTSPHPISIREFTASKQASFFASLKQRRFSGQLVLKSSHQEKWIVYLYLGRIVYGTGGTHPVRRWKRNLARFLPQIASQVLAPQLDLSPSAAEDLQLCWEYKLLCGWVEQKQISRDQATTMIRSTFAEVLFDIMQTMEVICELNPDILPSNRPIFIDADQGIAEAQQNWQAWQGAKVADRSPDKAPVIRQPQQLQQRTSPQTYQTLSQMLNGQQSLRDLSVRMKRDVVAVTSSLLPYMQLGLVDLVSISDFPPPIAIPPSGTALLNQEGQPPLIACIDDSPLMCQTLEKILVEENYRFIGINDPLRAIAVLLSQKPDLIFLDLVMPNANGYEICAQLRKLSFFRNTPIIILTGNDGIIDRVRAKMVGSSDFLSKPVNAELVLETIEKHLRQEILS